MGEKPASGDLAFTHMENQDWIERWDTGKTGFHNAYVHPMLERNLEKLTGGKENLKVFVPMCGKSLDIKWLANQDHTVYGVELAEKALADFFKEHDIPYTKEAAPSVDGIILRTGGELAVDCDFVFSTSGKTCLHRATSDDGKIVLFCCDLFKFSENVAGLFDIIWDRGSLVAINREDREKYAALLKSLMAPKCKYLACTVEYDETIHKGPPHNFTDEAMEKLFGDTCVVAKIDREDSLEDKHREWGLTSFYESLFLIEQRQV